MTFVQLTTNQVNLAWEVFILWALLLECDYEQPCFGCGQNLLGTIRECSSRKELMLLAE